MKNGKASGQRVCCGCLKYFKINVTAKIKTSFEANQKTFKGYGCE